MNVVFWVVIEIGWVVEEGIKWVFGKVKNGI